MKQHNSIFGDLTADEIKAKLAARRQAKEVDQSQSEKIDHPVPTDGPTNTDATA